MAGPPNTVKIASPIPTHMFNLQQDVGVMNRLQQVPTMFQHHTGSPNALAPSFGLPGIAQQITNREAQPVGLSMPAFAVALRDWFVRQTTGGIANPYAQGSL